MKHFFTLLFFVFFVALLNAQSWEGYDQISYRVGNMFHTSYGNWGYAEKDTTFAAKGVSLVKTSHYSLNTIKSVKKKEHEKQEIYDSRGYKIKTIEFNTRSKEKVEESYDVSQKGRLQRETIRINGKVKYEIRNAFDSTDRILSYSFYKRKLNKPVTLNRYEYRGNKLYKKWVYKKDTVNYKYVYENSYINDTGELVSTIVEDAKGKRKYTWDYDCSHFGKLSKKASKTETKVCKSSMRLPNGHRQEVWIEDYGKENYRYINEYDSTNRLIMVIGYRGKFGDKLYFKRTYVRNSDTLNYTNEYYKIKTGQVSYKYESIGIGYNHMLHKIVTHYNRKGRKSEIWETEYSYNGDLLVRTQELNANHPKKAHVTEYEYIMK